MLSVFLLIGFLDSMALNVLCLYFFLKESDIFDDIDESLKEQIEFNENMLKLCKSLSDRLNVLEDIHAEDEQ